jgi:prepilin-type processing-associated H-X9-DG protein
MALGLIQYQQDYDEFFPMAQRYGGSPSDAPDGYRRADGSVSCPGYACDAALDANASWYPCSWCTANPITMWGDAIYPYHKSKQMDICPNSRRIRGGTDSYAGTRRFKSDMNYGASQAVMGYPTPVKITTLKKPSSVFMIADGSSAFIYGGAGGAGEAPGNAYGCAYCAYGRTCVSGVAAGHGCEVSPTGVGTVNCDNGANYNGGSSRKEVTQDLMGRHFEGLNVAYADGHVKYMTGKTMVAKSKQFIGGGMSPWNVNYDGPE